MTPNKDPRENTFGISPLGGNSVEGTGTGLAAVRDESVQGVPLVFDGRVGNYISEQAVDELDDRDETERAAREYQREDEWRAQVGFRKSIQE